PTPSRCSPPATTPTCPCRAPSRSPSSPSPASAPSASRSPPARCPDPSPPSPACRRGRGEGGARGPALLREQGQVDRVAHLLVAGGARVQAVHLRPGGVGRLQLGR